MRPASFPFSLSVACLGAFALAAPAGASECPQSFGSGLIVVSDDGGEARLTMGANGLLQEVVTFPDGGDFRTESLSGVFILFWAEIDQNGNDIPDSVERWTPDVPLSDLPAIVTGANFSGQFSVAYGDGDTDVASVMMSVGAEVTRSFGACSYAVLPVTMRERFNEDEDYLTAFDYIPALGVALIRATGDWGRAPDLLLEPIAIRAID